MVKPVSLENPLNRQFSEMASNTLKANKDANNDKVNADSNVDKTELAISNENATLRNAVNTDTETATKESVEEIEQAFEEIAQFMNMYNRNVNFSMDEKSEKTVIKVFDSDSKELIKQFPSEDLVKLAQKIRELRQDIDLKSGIFLDEKV